MRVLVLGPVEAHVGTAAVGLEPKERTLLAALVARVGRRVSASVLIDALWSQTPPRTAHKSLQGHVFRLRRKLGAQTIMFRDGGYALTTSDVTVDAIDAERLLVAAQEATAAGYHEAALSLLVQAERLWRGEPYEGVPPESLPSGEVSRLGELRLSAFEDRMAAALRCHRYHAAVAELEAFVAVHPLREAAWAQLITALYHCGRTADALSAYGRVRVVLAEELGLVPGPLLRELEAAILTQDIELLGSHATRRPMSDLPPTLAEQTTRPMVGRAEAMQALAAAFDVARTGQRRFVTITGEAGIGKTRLAAATAQSAMRWGAAVALARGNAELCRPFGPIEDALVQLQIVGRGPAATDAGRTGIRSEVERIRLADEIDAAISVEAYRRPVVLVVDDLQWMDVGTLESLRRLAWSERSAALLVIVTWRDHERPPAVVRTACELDRTGRHVRITLDGLTPAELGGLVGLTSREADASVVGQLLRRTDGNPLLAVEMLRFRHGEGAACKGVPAAVRDLVDAELSRSPRPVASVLEVGSVLGRAFDPRLASAVVQRCGNARPWGGPGPTVDGLMATGLVREDREPFVTFTHELVRDAVRLRRSTSWRQEVQRLVIFEESKGAGATR